MLKAKKIKKSFLFPSRSDVLKGVDLEVLPAQTIAIMGSSGVGKSTLLHILGTLEKPDSGELIIANQLVNFQDAKMRNQHIGFVFQGFFLFENLSVLENVLMPLKIARQNIKKGSKAYLNAVDLIDKVGLSHRIDHTCKLLSGGEKQRVCIARALANSPSVIFADEPTGNLDTKTSRQIQKLLIDTVKEHKKSLVLATHDPEFAKACDKVYQLKDGQLTPIDLTFK